MSNSFSFIYSRFYRRCLYLLLSVLVAVGICVGSPQKTQAISLFDLLNQGIQIFQLSTISDREEVQLSKQINQQLVNSDIKLYRNQNVNRYVNQVSQKLAANSTRPVTVHGGVKKMSDMKSHGINTKTRLDLIFFG